MSKTQRNTVFSTHLDNFMPFSSNLKLSSANSFGMEESKICCLGKGLKHGMEMVKMLVSAVFLMFSKVFYLRVLILT